MGAKLAGQGNSGPEKKRRGQSPAPWHFLNFLPLPQGTGSLRPMPAYGFGSDTGSNRRTLGGDGRIATHETIDRRLARDHGVGGGVRAL